MRKPIGSGAGSQLSKGGASGSGGNDAKKYSWVEVGLRRPIKVLGDVPGKQKAIRIGERRVSRDPCCCVVVIVVVFVL